MSETTNGSRRWLSNVLDAAERAGDATYPVFIDGIRALINDADRLAKLERIGRRVINSGILCDPGCCGDDCGCDELREALEK